MGDVIRIGGQPLDRGLLEAFEQVTRGKRDGRASEEDVENKIRARIEDGGRLTATELFTIQYALDHFHVTQAAKKALTGVMNRLANVPGFQWNRELNVLNQRLEFSGAGPSHLNIHLVDDLPVDRLFEKARELALAKMADPSIQRVEFSGRGKKPAVLFAFQGPTGYTYSVRLDKKGKTVWEHDFGDCRADFPTIPDLSKVGVSAVDAFKKAFDLLPRADWNNAAIGIRGKGKIEYHFWNSYAWRDQPCVVVDATTGEARIEQLG